MKRKEVTNILLVLFLIGQTALSYYAYISIDQTDSLFFKFEPIGILFSWVLNLLSYTSVYYSRIYLKQHSNSVRQESIYYGLLILLIAAMTGAYFAENMAILWVCIEATTLFVAGLIYHDRSKIAIEAAWKYLFITSIGVAIAFIGILFLSIVSGESNFTGFNFGNIVLLAKEIDPLVIKIAFVLVLTGFSAKMGVFPLYSAAIDAHTVAPPPVSAFISTTLMNVGFLGIFRVYQIVAQTDAIGWANNVLMLAGILSVFLATIQLLRIKHFKRMFAFSSLEHMGIVCIGIAVGGIGYYAAILHLVFHSLVKAGMFYQIARVNNTFNSYWIKDSGNYMKISPVDSLLVILSLVLITAIPPSGLFVTEFLVFKAMFLNDNIYLAILALFLLTIILFVITRKILHLLFAPQPDDYSVKPSVDSNISLIPVLILFALSVYLVIFPPPVISELIYSAIGLLK
ncbi:MAG: hypothetical protein KKA07_16335 [Bacteroidetes bacterium]|nr:hypothetical protein [Bacteroidota bacterium]MBU1720634.1 hypothetical protein [Bacteroidota bacterium]